MEQLGYRRVEDSHDRFSAPPSNPHKCVTTWKVAFVAIGLITIAAAIASYFLGVGAMTCIPIGICGLLSFFTGVIALICHPRKRDYSSSAAYSPPVATAAPTISWSSTSSSAAAADDPPPSLAPSVPNFDPACLSTFQALLQRSTGCDVSVPNEIEGTQHYSIWNDLGSCMVNIQRKDQRDKIEINISPSGNITAVYVDGKEQQGEKALTIPEGYLLPLQGAIEKSIEQSSTYTLFSSSGLSIYTVRHGVAKNPEFHLSKLAEMIPDLDTHTPFKITVGFLKANMDSSSGADAGGLLRDFLDDLFSGMVDNSSLEFFRSKNSGLVIPRTKADGDKLAHLEEEESTLYQNIGKLLGYCYFCSSPFIFDSKNNTIGRHFEDAMFSALLCLTPEEIETDFDELKPETLLKMASHFIEDFGENAKYSRQCIGLLQEALNDSLSNEELDEAAELAAQAETLRESLLDDDRYSPAMEKVRANKEELIEDMWKALYSIQSAECGQLGAQLAPLHAIAQGMYFLSEPSSRTEVWQTFQSVPYAVFSETIQGSIDRKAITQSFCVHSYGMDRMQKKVMKTKLSWLKDWIETEATTVQVQNLLKQITGCKSLPANTTIRVQEQSKEHISPLPGFSSCLFKITLAPVWVEGNIEDERIPSDNTRERFYKILAGFCDNPDTGYSEM